MGHRLFGVGPRHPNTIYGLFTANAAFISQNFDGQSIGTGAINVNDVAEPVNELTESATLGDGSASSGTIDFTRYSPGGRVVDTEAAAVTATAAIAGHRLHPAGPGNGDRHRPVGSSYARDGNNTTARDLNDPTEPMVISATSPTLTRTRSYNRKL